MVPGKETPQNNEQARAFDQYCSLLYERGPAGIRSRENEERKRKRQGRNGRGDGDREQGT